jgi:hypothetical protein
VRPKGVRRVKVVDRSPEAKSVALAVHQLVTRKDSVANKLKGVTPFWNY